MRELTLALVLSLLLAGVAHATLSVVSGPETYEGHVYYMLEASSWTDAEASAVELGGHLVTINDSDENLWVIGTFGGEDYALWTGLSDAAHEGTFEWSSGEAFTYGLPLGTSPPWAPNEPAGEHADYDYVNIHRGSHPSGPELWNDWPDGGIGTCHGIVEIPEPATVMLMVLGGLALIRRGKMQI